MMTNDRLEPIFGYRLSALTCAKLVDAMTGAPLPPGSGVRLVATMNLDHVGRLQRDADFRAAYARAWAITADGAPVFAYARWRGAAPPERVAGSDLLAVLAQAWRPGAHRLFFVVSTRETGERLIGYFAAKEFAPGAVAYASPPFGFERDAAASTALANTIRAHRATHLIMGVGAPKSEVWVDGNRGELGDLYAYGFGSGPDFLVGAAARAPEWMRRAGLEWAFRVAGDPRRLAKRYFVDSWAVLPAVMRDLRGRHSP